MKRVFAILVIAVLLLGGALGWRIHQGRAHLHAPSGGSGVVEGVKVDLSVRINAPILKAHVREGDRVKAGQLLMELDCTEPEALVDEARARLAMAQAGVDAAIAAEKAAQGNTRAARQAATASVAQAKAVQAERDQAVRESLRVASLHNEGAISDSLFETTETRVESVQQQEAALLANAQAAKARADAAHGSQGAALAQTTSAQSAVSAAEAGLRRAEILVGECQVKSPLSGVVLHRNFEPGELALPGAKLITIVNLEQARATFFLPNAELAQAKPGKAVQVQADAWPGEIFSGMILRVAAEAEFTPRNVQTRQDRDRLVYAVEVTIPNEHEKLRPGMPVDITIEGSAP